MAISISYNSLALSPNVTAPFSASGGEAPYTWSVISGGVSGTIDASTGIYTAPSNNYGVDVIQVTDSASNTAEIPVSVCTALELVCDIIQTSMALSSGQVYLYNQKWNIPTDSNLYVAVRILSCKPFANNRSYQEVNGTYSQIQSTNFQSLLSIDIMSRGSAARDQKEQVILALGSTYAESQMELNSFSVALLPTSFVNLSEIDGAAIPYRFNISAMVQYFVTSTNPVAYFDTFSSPQVAPDQVSN